MGEMPQEIAAMLCVAAAFCSLFLIYESQKSAISNNTREMGFQQRKGSPFIESILFLLPSGNPEPTWYRLSFPHLWHPAKNVVSTACVYMVVAVAAERYHAICHPLKYKPSPAFYLMLVLLLSVMVRFFRILTKKVFGTPICCEWGNEKG